MKINVKYIKSEYQVPVHTLNNVNDVFKYLNNEIENTGVFKMMRGE